MDPLRPDQLLLRLYEDLCPFVQTGKGQISIARDGYHFLELLAESPTGWRAVVHWDGDTNESETALDGNICTQRFSVGISCNLGLGINPDAELMRSTPHRRPLLRLVDDVRDRVLSQTWPDEITDNHMHYKGCEVVTLPDGIPLAAYALRFELTTSITTVVYRNP